jgi:ATP-binding cassette subfamily C (CFTR/MRP) protein 1
MLKNRFFVYLKRFYTRYARQLKRLESVSRSPIYAFFGECLNGVSTIRAFQSEQRYICQMQKHLDENTRIYYCDMYGNRWLGFRLEFTGSLIVFFASLLAVFGRESISAGIAGLSISYALNVSHIVVYIRLGS